MRGDPEVDAGSAIVRAILAAPMALVSKKEAVQVARTFLEGFELVEDGKRLKLVVTDVRARDDGLHVTYMVFFMEVQGGVASDGVKKIARAGAEAFRAAHSAYARIPVHDHFKPV
jgi:hypothetical protein